MAWRSEGTKQLQGHSLEGELLPEGQNGKLVTKQARAQNLEEGGQNSPKVSFWKGTSETGKQELSILQMARETLQNASSWTTAQGTLAPRLKAGGCDRAKIRQEPTPSEREVARKLHILASSASA